MLEELQKKTRPLIITDDQRDPFKYAKEIISIYYCGVNEASNIFMAYKDICFIVFKKNHSIDTFVLELLSVLKISKSVVVIQDCKYFIYPMLSGRDDMQIFCNEFVYVTNTYKFLKNNLGGTYENFKRTM